MPITMPMKVRKSKGAKQHQFTVKMPITLDDKELIEQRYGSTERMIDRANSQFAVDAARVVRDKLPDVDAADAALQSYCDDGRRTVVSRPTVTEEEAEEQGYTEEQKAFLRSKGIQI